MKVFLILLFSAILVACGVNGESSIYIDQAFVEENAEIGLTKDEVKSIFGDKYFSDKGEVENSEVWVYDRVKEGFEYEKSVQNIPFDEIRNGNVEYQLFINFIDNESFRYLYIYKGDDGQLWQYFVNPDGSDLYRQM